MRNGIIIFMCLLLMLLGKASGEHEQRIKLLEQQKEQTPVEEVQKTIYTEYSIPEWIEYCTSIRSLDPSIVNAIIKTESNWDDQAISTTNDYGLMQIHRPYWSSYFETDPVTITKFKIPDDPLNPYANILAGCNALTNWKKICEARGEDSPTAYIDCYNKGYTYFETHDQSYSNRVLANMQELQVI